MPFFFPNSSSLSVRLCPSSLAFRSLRHWTCWFFSSGPQYVRNATSHAHIFWGLLVFLCPRCCCFLPRSFFFLSSSSFFRFILERSSFPFARPRRDITTLTFQGRGNPRLHAPEFQFFFYLPLFGLVSAPPFLHFQFFSSLFLKCSRRNRNMSCPVASCRMSAPCLPQVQCMPKELL